MKYINGMAGGEMINAADINPTFKGYGGLITDIIRAITAPSDRDSDNDCLSNIWQLLEDSGYNLRAIQAEQELEQADMRGEAQL